MEAAATDHAPLMLIHGAWLTSSSWENFSEHFADRGFAVSTPEWPRKQGDVAKLRERQDDIKGLGLTEIVDHYEALIRALPQPPVLIGHSFGGLIVELLLDRGLGRAGVAMSPAPPRGILVLPFSSLKAAAPALAHPSKWHGVVPLTLEEFTYAFVNTFSPENAAAAYERYAVPETGQIFYEAGFANFHLHPPTEVHFNNGDRAPLLIVGFVAGIVVSLIQIVTSIQDTGFSTIPRLAAFLGAFLLSLPWMLNKMMSYTALILGDLSRYAR